VRIRLLDLEQLDDVVRRLSPQVRIGRAGSAGQTYADESINLDFVDRDQPIRKLGEAELHAIRKGVPDLDQLANAF
jgi:hypothetical protein